MADISAVTRYFPTTLEGFVTSLSNTITPGATIVPLSSVSTYPDGCVVVLVVDPSDTLKKQVFTGTIDTSGVRVINVKWTEGVNDTHLSGAVVADYVTATDMNMASTGIQVHANDDGTLKNSAKFKETTITSSSTPTPNADTTNIYTITALATAPTFGAPTGSPVQGQTLLIRMKDNATARALAWNAIYRAIGPVLPTTTSISKTLYCGFIYNFTDTKWDLIAVSQEA